MLFIAHIMVFMAQMQKPCCSHHLAEQWSGALNLKFQVTVMYSISW